MRLQGNKILITGATSGIGEALLDKFLSLDNHIIAVGRNAKKLDELTKRDERIIPFPCDLSKNEELKILASFIEERHPDTNILINNAGIQLNYPIIKGAEQLNNIDLEIAVNLTAPIKLTTLLLPILERNENSAIVTISSGLALVPKKQAPVYCGTKAGIHIFSKSLRFQLEHAKTKVFEIIPPLVDTHMTAGRGKNKLSPEALVEEFIRAFGKDNYEVSISKVKLLKIINRLWPAMADRIMKDGG